MASRKVLTLRVPETEMEILKRHCETVDRSQTEVVREFIRSLEGKLKEMERAS